MSRQSDRDELRQVIHSAWLRRDLASTLTDILDWHEEKLRAERDALEAAVTAAVKPGEPYAWLAVQHAFGNTPSVVFPDEERENVRPEEGQ